MERLPEDDARERSVGDGPALCPPWLRLVRVDGVAAAVGPADIAAACAAVGATPIAVYPKLQVRTLAHTAVLLALW